MKTYLLLMGLSLLACVADAGKKDIDTHSNVLLLDSENFDQALKEYKYILVDFFVPYCKKCSTVLRSEWGATAMQLRGDVRLGKVNISKGKNYQLAKRFELCEYPSIKFFKNGKISGDYDGGLTKRKILNWLEKKTAKSQAPHLDSKTQYDSFIKEAAVTNSKVPVIGYYSNIESSEAKAFLEAAEDSITGVEFAIASDTSAFSDLNVVDGQLIMHHPEIKDPILITVDGKTAEIKSAINKNKLPLLRDFVEYDMDLKMMTAGFENHLFVCTSFSSKNFQSEKEFLTNLASDYKGKILFVLVDMDEYLDKYTNILEFLEIKKAPAFALASIKKKGVTKYKPESDNIEEKNIRTFLEDYTNGNLTPRKDEL